MEVRKQKPLRGEIKPLHAAVLSGICIVLCLAAWWHVTSGEAEERIVNATVLPSPVETISTFKSLWFERAFTRNLLVTLKRVTFGFALASVVGVPLGIMAACFASFRAFLAPLVLFGRNMPIAALIGLTFLFFGIAETQKIMFIFFACVAFIIADTTTSVMNISQAYVDTAYTLGATRWQIIRKVLTPLALPAICDSLLLLFGLAFGYVMLAELVKLGTEDGGLGNLINVSLRRGPKEHVYLVVLIIPLIALAFDRVLNAIKKSLLPWKYGGAGLLSCTLNSISHGITSIPSVIRLVPGGVKWCGLKLWGMMWKQQ